MTRPEHQPSDETRSPSRVTTDLWAATNEILVALGRSSANPEEILDVIVARATSLCGADALVLSLVDGHLLRLSRFFGDISSEYRQHLIDHPIPRNRDSLMGRVFSDGTTQWIPDVLSDPDYGRYDLQELSGFRSLLSAPMLLDGDIVGVMLAWRTDPLPFDSRDADTLAAFAVQAAIVFRQVELMRSLEAQTTELASRLEQLEALRDAAEAVGSSLDLEEVLQRILTSAVRLSGADRGMVSEYYAATDDMELRAIQGGGPDLVDRLEAAMDPGKQTLLGRLFEAALEGRLSEAPDTAADPDPQSQVLAADGWLSAIGVPIHHEKSLLGFLLIGRGAPGSFPAESTELLATLAAQSAVAIVNARIYGELDGQRAELQIASHHKSEFLASMSHELRTPLNAVIGFSEVLLDRLFGELNERQDEYVRDIWMSGRHLLELLNEILDLSKVEAGQMVLEPSTFSVPGALDDVLSMIRERALAHGILVSLDVATELDMVVADELRFKQVVLNLLSNAVKFTPDGGTVDVVARRNERDLVVTVADSGVGIPTEDQERIFESFNQGRRGAPKEEGTGLGLTLSRRIVELYGGRLWLESEVEVGSIFGFEIPVFPDPDDAGATLADHQPGRRCVLIVDDDRASVDLLLAYLEGSDLDVLTARDGVEAMDLVRRSRPHAVVLDLRLPRRDGWTVLADLKSDPATQEIPVVVASIVDDRPRGLALGAAAYLIKPVRREDLLEALRDAGALPDGAPA